MSTLVLASSSPYRKALLDRLGLAYQTCSPDIDETAQANETAEALVKRLALAKAQAVVEHYPNSLIIGSDQVAVLNQHIMTKPLNHQNAVAQLTKASGHRVDFLTSLCLHNEQKKAYQLTIVNYHVKFLTLTERQIEGYLQKEQPYDCVGSFKSEGLGVTLFESMEGKDPSSLIGLPLIALTAMLRQEGIEPLNHT